MKILLPALFVAIGLSGQVMQQAVVNTKPPTVAAPTLTRVNYKYQYVANSGTGYSLGFTVASGDLLVVVVHAANNSAASTNTYSVSDSASDTFSSLPIFWFNVAGDVFDTEAMQTFYVLSAGASTTVTVNIVGSAPNLSDMSWTAIEYHTTSGAWHVDSSLTSGSGKDGWPGGNTTNPTSATWSTAGAHDVVLMDYFNDFQNGTYSTQSSGFAKIQYDSTQSNGQWEALNGGAGLGPQTSVTSSVTFTGNVRQWGLFISAFSVF